MIVTTMFRKDSGFEQGEVEVKLLPGIPQLQVVGLPDASLRECGIKLKSALRSCGLKWPRGHQIIVNLRPSHLKKSSAGADLAIALGFLALTKQLSTPVLNAVNDSVVYGEIALDGRVLAPHDAALAVRAVPDRLVLTGIVRGEIREGRWSEIRDLRDSAPIVQSRFFDWVEFWRKPELPDLKLHEQAAKNLALAIHANLSVMVAGPQGSGKTTWARALFALTEPPEKEQMLELADMFGDEILGQRWRPCEQPHHTITTLGMIGGGVPVQPGVISRAHGGVLIMDEFLEFNPQVLEALREPVENGVVEIARVGERIRWPARFQLVATSNLCLCGRLVPGPGRQGCGQSLGRCRSVCDRLSGPVMDRFDLLLFSNKWLKHGEPQIHLSEIAAQIRVLKAFAAKRGAVPFAIPSEYANLSISHRRRRSLLRVARALADFDAVKRPSFKHFSDAADLVLGPMDELRLLFG